MGRTKIKLNDSQRLHFLEILLIVGSILAAFKLPATMSWLFWIFVFCSLLYYVVLHETPKPKTKSSQLIPGLISASFAAVVVYNFGVSLIQAFSMIPLLSYSIIGAYYVLLWLVIYLALRR